MISIPPDKVRLIRELKDILQECSVHDWNGYGAEPISPESVCLALEFLKILPNDISYPELNAEPSGDLTMIWRKRGYHVVLGIDAVGKIAWGGTGPHGHIYGDAQFAEKIPEEVLNMLHTVEGI